MAGSVNLSNTCGGTVNAAAGGMHRDMKRTLETADIRQRLSERGFEVIAGSSEEFLSFVRAESDKLGKLIRDNRIQVD
jgi:tripartite-type tricarboxylate transporter receptor subunit TctC